MKGGLTATATLITEKHENALYIPLRALKGTIGNYRADVLIDPDKNTYDSRPVTIGIQTERFVEILSGLSEGDQVIIGTPPGAR